MLGRFCRGQGARGRRGLRWIGRRAFARLGGHGWGLSLRGQVLGLGHWRRDKGDTRNRHGRIMPSVCRRRAGVITDQTDHRRGDRRWQPVQILLLRFDESGACIKGQRCRRLAGGRGGRNPRVRQGDSTFQQGCHAAGRAGNRAVRGRIGDCAGQLRVCRRGDCGCCGIGNRAKARRPAGLRRGAGGWAVLSMGAIWRDVGCCGQFRGLGHQRLGSCALNVPLPVARPVGSRSLDQPEYGGGWLRLIRMTRLRATGRV